jgi:hypothetical protein
VLRITLVLSENSTLTGRGYGGNKGGAIEVVYIEVAYIEGGFTNLLAPSHRHLTI